MKKQSHPESSAASTITNYKSIGNMREAHRELLKRSRDGESSSETWDLVEQFIKRGVQTGRVLDLPEDRAAAQDMLDFWVSRMASSRAIDYRERGTASSTTDTVLLPFEPQTLQDISDRAVGMWNTFNQQDRDLALRLLLRMTRLDPQTKGVVADRVAMATLHDMDDPRNVDRVLSSMQEHGIVRTENDAKGQETVGVTHEALMRAWEPLSRAVDERIKFREAAEFWQLRDRDPTALFPSGQLLDAALRYRDLGDLEQAFADASRLRRQQSLRARTRWLAVAVAVLTLGLCTVAALAWRVHVTNNALARKQNQLDTQNVELQNNKLDLEKQLERLKSQHQAALQADDYYRARLGDLSAIVEQVLAEKTGAPKDSELYKYGMEFKEKYESWLRESQVEPETSQSDTLRPGSAIGTPDLGILGSAGAIFTDQDGKHVLLTPNFVIPGQEAPNVTRYDPGSQASGQHIGDVTQSSSGSREYDSGFSVIQLDKSVKVSNEIEGIGEIAGVADEIRVGSDVVVNGAKSGTMNGKIKRVEKSGTIVTTGRMKPEDVGAPVVTADGKLIGLVTGSQGDETYVAPVKDVIRRRGMKIYQDKK